MPSVVCLKRSIRTPHARTSPSCGSNGRPPSPRAQTEARHGQFSYSYHPLGQDSPPTLVLRETTGSEPTLDDCSEPTLDDCSEPTSDNCSEPTLDDCSEPTSDDCSEPTIDDCFEPTLDDCSEPTLDDCFEPTLDDCSEARCPSGHQVDHRGHLLPRVTPIIRPHRRTPRGRHRVVS